MEVMDEGKTYKLTPTAASALANDLDELAAECIKLSQLAANISDKAFDLAGKLISTKE